MIANLFLRRARTRIEAEGASVQEQQRRLRTFCGKLAGVGGLIANLCLFVAKFAVGLLSGSVSIIADALNNLSDCGSAVVTLFGVRMAFAPPDKEHPFGHGRMEYLSTMLVAVLIMLAGYELAKNSVSKIFTPQATFFSWVTVAVLIFSILVKIWLALFYRRIGLECSSQTVQATFADSRNDVLCTVAVLFSTLLEHFTGLILDGYIGLLVALFILWSGFSIIKSAVAPLLGQKPDEELVQQIRETVLKYQGVLGIHDLIVHDYGPGRCIVSLHVEVSSGSDILISHDMIDTIERELMEKFHITACIHMDPVDTEDERVPMLRTVVEEVLMQISDQLQVHDFRVVFGETHTNLIFDLEVPFGFPQMERLPKKVEEMIQQKDPKLFTVITVENRLS